jgi:hypothetical protein
MAYEKKHSRSHAKEVGTRPSMGSTEESFGSKPPKIAIGGGTMCTFGFKPHDGVWPKAENSVDVKTGFPEGFDKPKKSPKP